MQQFKPFRRYRDVHLGNARDVATGPVKAADEADIDRVGTRLKDDCSRSPPLPQALPELTSPRSHSRDAEQDQPPVLAAARSHFGPIETR
jgi:hypothetical protein